MHGKSDSREYTSWLKMKYRCSNAKNARSKDWLGRNVTVCDRWLLSFEDFYQDMGPMPADKNSIDRIDVNGNYEPENCRWADNVEQANNTTSNVYITLDGEVYTIAQAAKKIGLKYGTLYKRYVVNGESAIDAVRPIA